MAQGVSYNTTGAPADASAMLDVQSTSKGVLVPRMTAAQMAAIATPATGLMVFQTDGTAGYYYYSGSAWTMVGNMPAGTTTGDMLYWNGSSWSGLSAGTSGKVLIMSSGVPAWSPTTALTIGQSYGGGKIAYLLQSGDPGYDPTVQHGLIAATSDQSTGITWEPSGNPLFAAAGGTGIGTGKVNTDNILNSTNYSGTAAYIARSYAGGGFTDWYLPSKDELNKLYINRVTIGGFASAYYWSSSEFNTYGAWLQYFDIGFQDFDGRLLTAYVRAVRSF